MLNSEESTFKTDFMAFRENSASAAVTNDIFAVSNSAGVVFKPSFITTNGSDVIETLEKIRTTKLRNEFPIQKYTSLYRKIKIFTN